MELCIYCNAQFNYKAELKQHLTKHAGETLAPDVSKMGVKYDQGKDRWDLLPWRPIKMLVQILTFGAQKYAPNGWRTVPDAEERYFAGLMRHLVAFRQGEWLDPESKMPHLAHAICNLVFIYELRMGVEGTEKKDS